jgi:hypothetical protein
MKNSYKGILLIKILFTFNGLTVFAQRPLPENKDDSLTNSKSSLQVGASFSSKALSSGRDFGVSQYIITPFIGYYHKSGFHTAIEGNLLSDLSPKYNLTVVTMGYSGSFTSKWNYAISYSRNFFNPDTAGLIKSGWNGSVAFLPNYFNASLQYSYLSGDEKAHRLVLGANGYLSKEFSNKAISYISCSPGVFFTFGTANVPFNRFTPSQFQKGTGSSWEQWRIQRTRRRSGTNSSSESLEFGWMNTDLSLPLSINLKNLQIGVSYTYAIPQKLSEEENSEISATGYLGVSINYNIR